METLEQILTVAEVRSGSHHGRTQIVDVRSSAEFASGHLPGAMNVPMEQLESRIADLNPAEPVILVCQAGRRADLCRQWLAARGVESRVMSGGMNAWEAAGFPQVRSTATRWALERQVRLAAGLMTLTGALLAAFANPAWIWLAGFVGAGLVFAGLTGFCGMANVLATMPWNQAEARSGPDRVA